MCTVSSKITVLLPTVKLSAFTYYESRQFYFILPTSTPPQHTRTHTVEIGVGPAEVNWKDVTDNKRHDHKHDSLLLGHYGIMAVCLFFLFFSPDLPPASGQRQRMLDRSLQLIPGLFLELSLSHFGRTTDGVPQQSRNVSLNNNTEPDRGKCDMSVS